MHLPSFVMVSWCCECSPRQLFSIETIWTLLWSILYVNNSRKSQRQIINFLLLI